MAHMFSLVDVLEFRIPKLKELTIISTGGEISLGAWGLSLPFNDLRYRIGTVKKPMPEDSKIISSGAVFDPTCAVFLIRGLKVGDEVAVFENRGNANPPDWVRISEFATVKQVFATEAEKYAKLLKDKALPRSVHNAKISFFPYGSMQRNPPVSGDDWIRSVEATLGQICASALGKRLIGLIDFEVIIQCYISDDINAYNSRRLDGWKDYVFRTSVISFSPQTWAATAGNPGERADEVLLHELIHALEDNFSEYTDSADGVLKFDKADFLTVNGTNVYSRLLGRQLRKDHGGFLPMPEPYNSDPERHYKVLQDNYIAAFRNNDRLFMAFSTAGGTWNPFRLHRPGALISSEEYRVEVLPDRNWVWIYPLNSNGTAAWRDLRNAAERGRAPGRSPAERS